MSELLQEYFDSRGVTVQVEPQAGILRGVKLIGLESRNGRRYQESALDRAVALYEGAKVNVNHPKEGPLAPRDYQDRLGVIREVNLRVGDGLYGDLHFNPRHSLAEQLVWDAEHNPRNVGFSHNVMAKLSREGKTTVVEEITHVQSVDLVADPAATQGLFEEIETPNEASKWDVLTIETLRLHRPDLLEEIEGIQAECLQQKVSEAQAKVATLERRHKVLEMLNQYDLHVPRHPTESRVAETDRVVSPAFFEMLIKTQQDEELETLVAERAALARENLQSTAFAASPRLPQSRDQLALMGAGQSQELSAEDFARVLMS